MSNDDVSSAVDRDNFDGDECEPFVLDGVSDAEGLDRLDDPDAEPDDAMITAELSTHAIAVDDEIEDELDDEVHDLDDDDWEITLLQELGIDLDAHDDSSATLESLALDDDDVLADDEVAA